VHINNKNLSKLEIEGNFLNLIKNIYKNPTPKIKLETFLLSSNKGNEISSNEVAKVLELQPQHHSFQRNPKADLLQNVYDIACFF